MNAAATRAMRLIPRWAWLVLALSLLMLFCAGLKAFDRGPLYCESCWLGAPDIDQNTKDFLDSKLVLIDDYVPLWMHLTNTTYTICNLTHCAAYYQTFDGLYMTKEKVPRDQPPADDNPWAGGGGGGGGYGGGGGGGGGGGSGSVTVGDPETAGPPNQEN